MGFESLNQVQTVLEVPRVEHPAVARVRAAMGNVPAPKEVWQKAFDYDEGHLERLVKLRRGELAEPYDLIEYALDFEYEEVQPELFRFAFPLCLDAWRRDLHAQTNDYAAFVEHFYPALAKTSVFEKVLTPEETRAVSSFMREEVLHACARQRLLEPYEHSPHYSPPFYRWVEAFTTYGVIFPDMARLWAPLWQPQCAGHAISLVYYVSCLVYSWDNNPAFKSVAPGWGPPELWEFGGHLYKARWQGANLEFLEGTLSWASLTLALERALSHLDPPEALVAEQVLRDCRAREVEVSGHIKVLREKLSGS